MNQFKGEPFQARLEKLNQQKDFLHRLNQIIPWEEFRPPLEPRQEGIAHQVKL